HPPTPVAAACATLASIGFGASLVQQQRLLALTPPELTGHALGLHSAGMLTLQGLSAGAAGAVAQWTSPGVGITVMAAASAAVTLGLWAAGRDERRAGLTSPARTRTY
ncbi:MFS transporter, partial [Streptomyces ipomoeae]|nr:MFS transporter [Streptomyces ipomoeae]